MSESLWYLILDIPGFNDVSWHNPDIITPNMESLAKDGVILESAYMQPMCTASRSALLTGYYPIHTGRQVGQSVRMTLQTCPLYSDTGYSDTV